MKSGDAHNPGVTGNIDIAIIGMSCRFPGARNIEEFWQNLSSGTESVSFFSDEELRAAGADLPEALRPDYVKAAAILGGVDQFDASFFGFSPRDAELLDPQQRIFIECVWEALESAGYQPDDCGLAVGVYAGSGFNTYLINNILATPELAGSLSPYQYGLLNDKDFLATRVSYKLNLKGPSVVVQTACSTSLVAVHLACQSLLNYECDMAVAGGVTIHLPEVKGHLYQEGGVTSLDGHCRAFDAKARGTVNGNGAGVVVLRRLEDAQASGDNLLAVIKGSAINNDGAAKVGFTAPSIDGQAQVIQAAQIIAGVEPETISYIEAHGTGTALGDPIEIAALTQAFRTRTGENNFCAIGSVKTNIGHVDTAAGVSGLIKTVLALQHRLLPPSLHFETPNPMINFADSPFYVNTVAKAWETGGPRRAGISSFGMGGTNAHVIVEEAQPSAISGEGCPWQLVVLSARSEAALDNASANLVTYLDRRGGLDLADVAFTLQLGRKAFDHRRVVVCRNLGEAVRLLTSREPGRVFTGATQEGTPEVIFMFPGQGSQYVEMGRELYQHEPAFRAEVDYCAEQLKLDLRFDLRQILYPFKTAREEAARRLDQTSGAQVTLFVIEYALARLWMSWGVRPQAMVGHSIGEYVAACLAGVLSLDDALRLVALRGRLMQEMPPGLMLAVALDEEELESSLPEALSLAAVNGPARCVVSGPAPAVEAFEARLLARGVECRRLRASHAFHSEMMRPASERLAAAFSQFRLQPPSVPYLSNLTGAWIKAEEAMDPGYWAGHLRRTVRFSMNVQELLKRPANQIIVEVGPGQALSGLTVKHLTERAGRLVLSSMRQAQQEGSDVEFLLAALGRLWIAGAEVSWRELHAGESRRRVSLPTYPFERQRYWIDPPRKSEGTPSHTARLQRASGIESWLFMPVWKQSLPPGTAVPPNQKWLLFIDDCGLGAEVGRLLSEMSHEVVTVRRGECFRCLGVRIYEIDPRRQDDYDALLRNLQAGGQFPQQIVHLWAVTADECQSSSAEAFDETQEVGFNSLLRLARAWAALNVAAPLQLCVVSTGLQMIMGTETARPEKATLLGLCKVIPLEFPNVICRSIDVTLQATGQLPGRLSALMAGELLALTSEQVVAYRGEQRWVQVFENLPAGTGNRSAIHGVQVKEGGVYLITGGLGNIGLSLAGYLAETPAVKLVLVGRSGLPQRDEWEPLLAAGTRSETVRKILAVREIESCGAEVVITPADVSDRQQMRALFNEVRDRFGRLDGVIHAAGLIDESWFKPIQETDQQLVEAHFRPKVRGLLVVDELLRGFSPDFCLLASSLSSILGGIGYAAYAAANAFMDALAWQRHAKDGLPWISVNWDGWQAPYKAAPETAAMTAPVTKLGITPDEGVKAFARLLPLATVGPQIFVSTTDLNARLRKLTERRGRTCSTHEPASEEAAPAHSRTAIRSDYVAPANEVEKHIVKIWEKAIGMRPIGIHDSFFELGGDSLLAMQLLPRLCEHFQVELTLRSFFERPTAAELTSLIAHLQQERTATHEMEILKMLDLLSEEEIEAELNKRTQSQELKAS